MRSWSFLHVPIPDPPGHCDLTEKHLARVLTMLRAMESWFEDVQDERLTITGALR